MIHLKSGKTLTPSDCMPWEVDPELITSIEKQVGNIGYIVCSHPAVLNLFVRTYAVQSIVMGVRENTLRPPQIMKETLGGFIETKKGWLKIELVVEPQTKKCFLKFTSVEKPTKKGK